MRVEPASTLDLSLLRELFNEGFSEYLVPMELDDVAFRDHLNGNDIDLECSQVAIDDRPAALALIARRGAAGWVGGMGTAPPYRRRGLGERALVAGVDAARRHGCHEMWLEVIEGNRAAIALYEKLGFEFARDLIVWSLPARQDGVPPSQPVAPERAQAWIAAHRESREPWQRADESLARMRARGAPLRGLTIDRGGQVAAAVVFRDDPDPVVVLQVAAVDDDATADALLAAAGRERGLRLSNAPAGEAAERAMERLGAARWFASTRCGSRSERSAGLSRGAVDRERPEALAHRHQLDHVDVDVVGLRGHPLHGRRDVLGDERRRARVDAGRPVGVAGKPHLGELGPGDQTGLDARDSDAGSMEVRAQPETELVHERLGRAVHVPARVRIRSRRPSPC